jgi:DNA (cytosine-5)-methyltransferase 1
VKNSRTAHKPNAASLRAQAAIAAKIARVRMGALPRVLDLFSGCGGISVGFQRAGFEIAGAIEYDSIASASHAANFFRHLPEAERALHSQAIDITKIEPADYVRKYAHTHKIDDAFDVIVGGPPCQAFARVGRAKLREVAEHPEAFKRDVRGDLYLRYLAYVRDLKPIAILMENVPDVLNYGGHNIPEEICETLDDLGYECRYTLLNAVHYGVPQLRERMFLLAYHRDLGITPEFPLATNRFRLPQGYESSRQVALKTLRLGLFSEDHYYVDRPPVDGQGLPTATTAREALEDLPAITAHLSGGLKRGARRFDELAKYRNLKRVSSYALLMRTWEGFESDIGVHDHVIRSLPRDYAIFRRMNAGDQYPEALQHALSIFDDALTNERKRGARIEVGSTEYDELRKQIVPPYDAGKFPNKWRKIASGEPARTLMAHLGKDGYSHIHYDSDQARTISVREAARLQSFPDGFVFAGTMNPAFRQIGNAVPPLIAYHIARAMKSALGMEHDKEDRTQAAD